MLIDFCDSLVRATLLTHSEKLAIVQSVVNQLSSTSAQPATALPSGREMLDMIRDTAKTLAPIILEYAIDPSLHVLPESREERKTIAMFANMMREYLPEDTQLSTNDIMQRLYQMSQENLEVSMSIQFLADIMQLSTTVQGERIRMQTPTQEENVS